MVESILEKVVRNCQRMETLVKNLLMLADIDSIPIPNYQPCDLGSLMEECLRIVRSVYPTAQIVVRQEDELSRVEVEPSLLELALLNLLGNAAKYSKAPAEILIRMQKEGEEAKIVIQDRGIGIPPQDIDHIFERFYTVNKAHSRKLGGAGLGLSLVKTILEKHGGSIQAESILNEGSTFTVKIPLCQGARICT
jgi:two-component system phosphate regulon sensor histidine kinase PhoR